MEEAKAVYLRRKSTRCFEEDLCAHLEHGYMYSGPDLFVMARPVLLRMDGAGKPNLADVAGLGNLGIDQEREANCWFVWLAAGRLLGGGLERLIPYPLEFVAWHRRRGKLNVYALASMRRRTHGNN